MRNTAAFTLIVLAIASSGEAKDRDWKLGLVLDSKSSQTTLATGATTNTTGTVTATAQTTGTATTAGGTTFGNTTTTAGGEYQQTSVTVVHHMTIRDTELVIVGQDYAYVIDDPVATSGPLLRKAIANHKHGCRFIIGEDIKYVQEKGKLIVSDTDGKQCDLDIVRQEKVQH